MRPFFAQRLARMFSDSTAHALVVPRFRPPLALALACVLCLGAACKPSLIPGTNVEDTEDNREIFEFLSKYRDAVVERNADAVTKLCAEDYFEDSGTLAPEDDYGLVQLRTRLSEDFGRTKELHLDILVQKITAPDSKLEPKQQLFKVAYRYNTRALVQFPAGDRWVSLSEINEVVLRKHDGEEGFRIVAGL